MHEATPFKDTDSQAIVRCSDRATLVLRVSQIEATEPQKVTLARLCCIDLIFWKQMHC